MKRLVDIAVAGIALVLLMPVIAIVAWRIRQTLGKPVLFSQKRIGKDNKPFQLLKFRSMGDLRDENGQLLPDDMRISDFGLKLRSSSLDELPTLLNVLAGDMSLVGPRPLLPEYLPLYNSHQARRHEVKPGVTGWAQINGRNSLSWEEKFDLDVWYVDSHSFLLDFKILVATLTTVLKREGINEQGEVSMSRFTGSAPDRDSEL